VLAIEPNQAASGSMGRSWDLTKTAVFQDSNYLSGSLFSFKSPFVSVTNYIPSILLEVFTS
jgi:hypothetical protein